MSNSTEKPYEFYLNAYSVAASKGTVSGIPVSNVTKYENAIGIALGTSDGINNEDPKTKTEFLEAFNKMNK